MDTIRDKQVIEDLILKKKKIMRLFVTGSNGYIGRNFIKKTAKKNYKIYAVTRKKK